MKYQAIKTEAVGVISGRDAIYLDEFKQIFDSKYNCIFKGEFNSILTEITSGKDFIPYTFSFSDVIYYQCCELDLYINEKKLDSSFDLVCNSSLIQELKNGSISSKISEDHKHYVLQTYDYVFDIIAKDYKLVIENE
ncbi:MULTISPECIES: hypothetical protein [unclassified Gilliamella]|uniref:hypothetical protein n=1 Tax=unclassified Gilliamella TaxID=2685620 RepID=UPI000A35AF28|nr:MULTISPECIES: hypothetical protein [unclassified Gilliamella]OTQ74410.1 hypothetical protein B6C99_04510 [Gilliamella sp. N-G2]OTQ80062.1 hypothetical protein B6D23_03480 [Gilliamella sp. N-W3]